MKFDALFIISSAIHTTQFRESLDLIFAYASFDRKIALVFSGHSAAALNINLKSIDTCSPSVSSRIKLMSMYDIEDVFTFNAPAKVMIDSYQQLNQEQLRDLFDQSVEVMIL